MVLYAVPRSIDSILYPWTGDTCPHFGELEAQDEATVLWSDKAKSVQYITDFARTVLKTNFTIPDVSVCAGCEMYG